MVSETSLDLKYDNIDETMVLRDELQFLMLILSSF
jgi:hypothetical protein